MNKIVVKLIISIIALSSVFTAIKLLQTDNHSASSGDLHLILEDGLGNVVFDDWIAYEEEMTFFDILHQHFDVTCANANYQADESCSYTFSSFGTSDKVILGIKGTNFELITDWQHTYLSIYQWDGLSYVLSSQGVMQLEFSDQDTIKIKVQEVW